MEQPLRRLCRQGEVVPHVGWHVFRQSFANELLKTNVSIYKVPPRLGHAGVTVTEQRYAPLAPSGFAVDLMSALTGLSADGSPG